MPADKQASAETTAERRRGRAPPLAKLGLTLERPRGGERRAVADVDPDSVAADHGLQAGRRDPRGRRQAGRRARPTSPTPSTPPSRTAASRCCCASSRATPCASSPCRRSAGVLTELGLGSPIPQAAHRRRQRDPPPLARARRTGGRPIPRWPAALFSEARRTRLRYMSAMRILIIEDDRDAAAYLVKAFREAGHARRPRRRRRQRLRPRAGGRLRRRHRRPHAAQDGRPVADRRACARRATTRRC